MLLGRFLCILVFAVTLGASPRASAGIFSGFFQGVGRDMGQGAVEKLEPVLARSLASAETVGGNLISKTSKEAGERLDQVNGILEKRLLQVKLGADEVLDRGLDKIDKIAANRLAQINSSLANRIEQVSSDVKAPLKDADDILKNRIADVGQVVTGAIGQADSAIAARIEQLDEVAGRQLANVDVIATKQRLGLETTITRVAWLVALVVFIVFLLRGLWTEYVRADERNEHNQGEPARARHYVYLGMLGKSLLRHVAVGTVIAVLLAVIPGQLPLTATKELQSVTEQHAAAMEKALSELDWTRVRFHASQLEVLRPEQSARYRAMTAKAELLRDLLGRPTALATPADVAATLDRVQAIERVQTGRPDPDAQTVRAMILWQQGTTKIQVHQAATLAARALWISPRGFTLAPMARLIVEAYLYAPVPAGVVDGEQASASFNMVAAQTGESESTEGLLEVLRVTTPAAPGSPFEGADVLFHLMVKLHEASNAAFVSMVEAQARVARFKGDRHVKEFEGAIADRTASAQQIIAAWQEFDRSLRDTPVLSDNPLVLSVFRINDVILSHALWFAVRPGRAEWPGTLASMNKPSDRAIKLAVAPARVVWARRYAGLLQGPARGLVELQEARRFQDIEELTKKFEDSYGNFTSGLTNVQGKRRAKRPASPMGGLQSQVRAANAAADLGLYTGPLAQRTPFALKITGSLANLQRKIDGLMKEARAKADKGFYQLQASSEKQLAMEIERLRQQLLVRGQRLI